MLKELLVILLLGKVANAAIGDTGYEFLNNGSILHMYNHGNQPDYYLEYTNFSKTTNVYQDGQPIWLENRSDCLARLTGTFNPANLTPMYCRDSFANFNHSVYSDNSTLTYGKVNGTIGLGTTLIFNKVHYLNATSNWMFINESFTINNAMLIFDVYRVVKHNNFNLTSRPGDYLAVIWSNSSGNLTDTHYYNITAGKNLVINGTAGTVPAIAITGMHSDGTQGKFIMLGNVGNYTGAYWFWINGTSGEVWEINNLGKFNNTINRTYFWLDYVPCAVNPGCTIVSSNRLTGDTSREVGAAPLAIRCSTTSIGSCIFSGCYLSWERSSCNTCGNQTYNSADAYQNCTDPDVNGDCLLLVNPGTIYQRRVSCQGNTTGSSVNGKGGWAFMCELNTNPPMDSNTANYNCTDTGKPSVDYLTPANDTNFTLEDPAIVPLSANATDLGYFVGNGNFTFRVYNNNTGVQSAYATAYCLDYLHTCTGSVGIMLTAGNYSWNASVMDEAGNTNITYPPNNRTFKLAVRPGGFIAISDDDDDEDVLLSDNALVIFGGGMLLLVGLGLSVGLKDEHKDT